LKELFMVGFHFSNFPWKGTERTGKATGHARVPQMYQVSRKFSVLFCSEESKDRDTET